MSEVRKPKTPPFGVTTRAITEEPWPEEEATGTGDPIQQLNARTKNAASASKAAFGAISELRRFVRDAVQQDKEDHERIYTTMDDVKAKVEKLETKVDKLSDHVGDLREQSARTGAHVERMVTVMEVRETAEVKAEVSLKLAAGKAEIEDKARVKKLKHQLVLKFAVPIVTALATAFSAYILTR